MQVSVMAVQCLDWNHFLLWTVFSTYWYLVWSLLLFFMFTRQYIPAVLQRYSYLFGDRYAGVGLVVSSCWPTLLNFSMCNFHSSSKQWCNCCIVSEVWLSEPGLLRQLEHLWNICGINSLVFSTVDGTGFGKSMIYGYNAICYLDLYLCPWVLRKGTDI